MSVLQTPRINFVGTISWSPGLANNQSGLFDSSTATVILPDGISSEQFPDYLVARLAREGIWNLYGSHDAKFEHYEKGPREDDNTRVVGGIIGSKRVEADPLIGAKARLNGKLVDLDPAAVWNSQIFFDRFSIGDSSLGFTATRHKTMHSRWINFQRNLDRLDIAGSAGVVWQTVFPKSSIRYRGAEQSPLLSSLKNAPDANGLMLRFATYRTLYFQNGIYNNEEYKPRDIEQLQQLHSEGKFFENPAYSRVVGSVGLWVGDEPETWPGGRFLVPANSIESLSVDGSPFVLGPAVAEVFNSSIALDFIHTIPELNRQLEKTNLGKLVVGVSEGGEFSELGVVDPIQYEREAYERDSGIITVPIQTTQATRNKLANGRIEVWCQSERVNKLVLAEQPKVVVAEQRDAYTTIDDSFQQEVRVFDRGQPASKSTSIVVGKYRGLRRTEDAQSVVSLTEDGEAVLPLDTTKIGPFDFGMAAFDPENEVPQLPPRIDITSGQFLSVRVLASDDELEANTSDDELTWKLIYGEILQNWDLMNPIMNLRGLPLSDEAEMTALAAVIAEVISKEMHESFRYMPITRDLSRGKRLLLERWAKIHN